MAKIKVVGDVMVVESTQTLESIKTLEKYNPKALCLYEVDDDGKKQVTFRVATTPSKGSINQYGAAFGSTSHDDRGVATITMALPDGVEDAKEYVAEAVGLAIVKLNKVEEQFAEALAQVESDKAAVLENIELA